MILLIDNRDSFTYNVEAGFAQLGMSVRTIDHRSPINDNLIKQTSLIVISPGPGSPQNSGLSLEVVRAYAGRMPIFGICLGMQVIAHCHGSTTVKADRCMHGKACAVTHTGTAYFTGIRSPMTVMRYNSLVIQKERLPASFEVLARDENEDIMAIYNPGLMMGGVQFHPDSYRTEKGEIIFKNVLAMYNLI